MVPFTRADLPSSGAEILPDGSILFTQQYTVCKQLQNTSGKVVGLLYKGPKMQTFDSMGIVHVKNKLSTYERRAQNECSDAVQRGLDLWEWAYGLFQKHQDSNPGPTHVIARPILQ